MRIISAGIKKTLLMIVFLLRLLRYRAFRNPIKKTYSGTAAVLANGPSLKEDLPKLLAKKDVERTDYIVMNYFAFDPVFFQLQPKHYCFADPMFFQDSLRIQDVIKLYDILQKKVDWEMNLYIPLSCKKIFLNFSKLSNDKIKIIGMNSIEYSGYECFRNYFYRKGISMPRVQTVVNMAIYVGLNSDYSIIKLYGVDHNFFDSICINEQNQLCRKYVHFYDNEIVELTPIIKCDGTYFSVSEYIEAIMYMFKSHDLLSQYAKYLGVTIFNCTKCSMIDSYNRKE
jgi:hypothetical protein